VHRRPTVWIVFRNRLTEALQRFDAQMISDVLLKTTTLPKRLTTHQPSVHLRSTASHPLAFPQQRSVGNSSHQHPQLSNCLPLSLRLNHLPRLRRPFKLRLHRSLRLNKHIWSPRLVRWIWMRITMIAVMRRRGRLRPKVRETARSRAMALVTIDQVSATAVLCWNCKDVGLARFKLLCKKYFPYICSYSFVDELMCLPITLV
jgi:hypothetical protein